MKSNSQKLLNIAIFRTFLTAIVYLLLPLLANKYEQYIGYKYIGYTVAGSVLLALLSIILLCISWNKYSNACEQEKKS